MEKCVTYRVAREKFKYKIYRKESELDVRTMKPKCPIFIDMEIVIGGSDSVSVSKPITYYTEYIMERTEEFEGYDISELDEIEKLAIITSIAEEYSRDYIATLCMQKEIEDATTTEDDFIIDCATEVLTTGEFVTSIIVCDKGRIVRC